MTDRNVKQQRIYIGVDVFSVICGSMSIVLGAYILASCIEAACLSIAEAKYAYTLIFFILTILVALGIFFIAYLIVQAIVSINDSVKKIKRYKNNG